jgi:branched-chain amino acid transport system ATP-binding protein
MLALSKVCAGYGRATVLFDVDMTLAEGEIVALVGANGAGKSTLVKTISGLLPISSGMISVKGERIDGLPPRQRVLRGIAHVPEGRQVFGGLTVEENLRLGAYAHRAGTGQSDTSRRIGDVCKTFPVLLERMGEPAANLSGGQQQMLAIARGLMSEPRLLLLDEPSLGLSPSLVVEIFRLVSALRAQGLTILLSEQNARQSLAVADRGYVIETGRIVLAGPARELLASSEIAEKYLGIGATSHGEAAERRQILGARLKAVLAAP